MINPQDKTTLTQTELDAFRQGCRWGFRNGTYYHHCKIAVLFQEHPEDSRCETLNKLGVLFGFSSEEDWSDESKECVADEVLFGIWLAARGDGGCVMSGAAGYIRSRIIQQEEDAESISTIDPLIEF